MGSLGRLSVCPCSLKCPWVLKSWLCAFLPSLPSLLPQGSVQTNLVLASVPCQHVQPDCHPGTACRERMTPCGLLAQSKTKPSNNLIPYPYFRVLRVSKKANSNKIIPNPYYGVFGVTSKTRLNINQFPYPIFGDLRVLISTAAASVKQIINCEQSNWI